MINNKASVFFFITSLILVIFTFESFSKSKSMIDKTVVKEFDIQRYLGTWYEIARYDHRFEKGLVGVTANYSINKDGKIKVLNSGYKETFNGEFSKAVGKIKISKKRQEPGKLKVSFFWFFYGDYYVLELDKNYQWALIGSSSDKYLWILSRTPIIDENLYDILVEKLKKRGYDTSKLIKVTQKK